MNKTITSSGKRKTAVARVTLKSGKGLVTINGQNLDVISPETVQLRIKTPLILADKIASKVDIKIRVMGGGVSSRAEACSLAIARALVEYDKKLEDTFLDYDRQLLVADVRRKEEKKPNRHGKARSKRQKSYR